MVDIEDLKKEGNALLLEAERRGYARGYDDGVASAKSKILAAIDGTGIDPAPETSAFGLTISPQDSAQHSSSNQERKRAPRGLPRALTIRVLKQSPDGVTPQQIADAAETDFEKMIAVSSIRGELRKGQEENRYLEVNGVWRLADKNEAEDRDLDVQPSASGNDTNKGGNPNAAAVTDLAS